MTITLIYAQDDTFAIYTDGVLQIANSGPISPEEILEITVGKHVATMEVYSIKLLPTEDFPKQLDASFFSRLVR